VRLFSICFGFGTGFGFGDGIGFGIGDGFGIGIGIGIGALPSASVRNAVCMRSACESHNSALLSA
jgi:hypothetical protein